MNSWWTATFSHNGHLFAQPQIIPLLPQPGLMTLLAADYDLVQLLSTDATEAQLSVVEIYLTDGSSSYLSPYIKSRKYDVC